MNKTMKLIAAAAALVAAVPAFAKIEWGNTNSASNNAELILVAYDEVAKVSFTKDLGTFVDTFKTQFDGHSKAASQSWNVSADANWNTFAGVANVNALKWAVLALDDFGGPAAGQKRLFTTASNTQGEVDIKKWTNSSFQTGIGSTNLGAFFLAVNDTGSHKNAGDGSSINYATESGNGYWAKTAGDNYKNAPFSNANLFGQTSEFFYVTRSGTLSSSRVLTERFESLSGVASTFTFGNQGGNVVLMAAAVPEPSTYAMLLGGLLALGLVVRRRTNDRR